MESTALPAVVAALAALIAQSLSNEELELAALLLTQLGDSLSLIAVGRNQPA